MQNPLTFMLCGLIVFAFTARAWERAAGSLPRHRALIGAFEFPRLLVPLATTWRQAGLFLMTLYALVLVVLVLPPTGALTTAWVFLLVLVPLHFLFTLGGSFIAARLGNAFPFTRLWIPWLFRVWMLASCAVWPLATFTKLGEPLMTVLQHNPLYPLIDMYRGVLIEGTAPSTGSLLEFAAWAVALPLIGIVVFWQGESRYAQRR